MRFDFLKLESHNCVVDAKTETDDTKSHDTETNTKTSTTQSKDISIEAMRIKGILEHLSFNHGISPHQNIDLYIIYESSWFSIDEDSE